MENSSPSKNKELTEFVSLVESGALEQVDENTYSRFISEHIKKYVVPCECVLNVFHLRKRIGAVYVELAMSDEAHDMDAALGMSSSYIPKYPKEEACYGWIELEGSKSFYMNKKLYPSWFHENLVHFDPKAIRELEEE